MNDLREFTACFNGIARTTHRYEVFRDFITVSAISLHNAAYPNPTLENEYLDIMGRYKKEEASEFPKLLTQLVDLLEQEPRDVLGQLYMNLDLGNLHTGQFFTPPEISKMMALINFEAVKQHLEERPFIRMSEPTCGAGGMVLAFVNALILNGYNPAKTLWVQCMDVDRLAALMCYTQLSLWNVPAEIIVGNSLSQEVSEVFYTPAYRFGGWHSRLNTHESNDTAPTLKIDTLKSPIPINTEKPQFDFGF